MDLRCTDLEPKIIKRVRGGWMAVTGRGAPVCIGACGDTEAEARAAFAIEIRSFLTPVRFGRDGSVPPGTDSEIPCDCFA